MSLLKIYCWKCPHYWGDSICDFGPADPTEDWCEITAGEIDPELLENDFEPGSEEYVNQRFQSLMSTLYFTEEEAMKIIKEELDKFLTK